MRRDKLYLVGFMGAGKSTLAQALGRRLGWRVEDIDAAIESRERRTIADIFAQQGEAYFRAVEREIVRQLAGPREVVVATGGGTFVDPQNRSVIRADGAVIWLDVPFDVAVERAPRDGRRPLATDRAGFEALYASRRAAYQQAHARFDASVPAEELVERILDWLGY
jgi:shikimate kinase